MVIPTDLALQLGTDGVRALWDYHHDWIATSGEWREALPWLVRRLLREKDCAWDEGRLYGFERVADHSENESARMLANAEMIISLSEEKNGLLRDENARLTQRVEQLEAAVKAAGCPMARWARSVRGREGVYSAPTMW